MLKFTMTGRDTVNTVIVCIMPLGKYTILKKCQIENFSHNNGNIKDFRQFSFITVETTLIKIYGPKKPLIIFEWVIPL